MGTLAALGVSILTAVILTLFGLELMKNGAEQIYEGITMLLCGWHPYLDDLLDERDKQRISKLELKKKDQ